MRIGGAYIEGWILRNEEISGIKEWAFMKLKNYL